MNDTFQLNIIESSEPAESDKVFWHGYVDFYEQWFAGKDFPVIGEFGLFRGDSIRWLLKRFPNSKIYGADILPRQSTWPTDDRFHFTQLNQENVYQVKNFLSIDKFDLIIEDGSHIPKHQVICLMESMKVLNSKGIYILEDIHTSLADQSVSNSLNILLAIDHYKRIDKIIDESLAKKIAKNSFFSADDVLFLSKSISRMSLYKRSHLPNKCFNCSSTDFDYAKLKCFCGAGIYGHADSMSFVLEKN